MERLERGGESTNTQKYGDMWENLPYLLLFFQCLFYFWLLKNIDKL